jgi:two-component system KDP operon response regulator KdpE
VSARHARVLLVEDSEAVRDAFTILLEESGYQVQAVPDGPGALAAAGAAAPSLVLLDLGLPGLDGVDVVRGLRVLPGMTAVPIVALTGRDDPETRRACSDAGCTDFLVKPIPTQQLLRAIAEHLGDS